MVSKQLGIGRDFERPLKSSPRTTIALRRAVFKAHETQQQAAHPTWRIMAQDNNSVLVDAAPLESFIGAALRKAGLPEDDAGTIARLMAEADLQGSDGHGVIRLPPYLKRIGTGGINIHPNIHVVTERAAMAVVD